MDRMSTVWCKQSMVEIFRCAAAFAALALVIAPPLSAQMSTQGGFDANGQCVGDKNGDGQVTVDEVLIAVNNALEGCQFMPVTLQFRANVGSQPFVCGNIYHNVGTTNADIVPADFRFYVFNIRLVTTDGKEVALQLDQDHLWQLDNIALLDFENKVPPCNDGTSQTNSVVHGKIAPGDYTGIRFTLGVPFERDHADASVAPSPLNISGLFWSWQDGYKFLRIDTAFDNVRVHLGSTECMLGSRPNIVTSCGRPNLGEVQLTGFNPASSVIVADLAALLADSDINSNQPNTAPGCQSDPDDEDCAPIFKNLGVNFDDGSPNPTSQKFFRVEQGTP